MAGKVERLDCPVCDGLKMEKLRPVEELDLALDYCDKCGGMWFESGEVRQLRFCPPEVLSSLISMKKQLYAVDCPCGHSMTRNSGECGSCGRPNTVDCPACNSELERVQSDTFTVDVCRDCRGVWFDNIDLSAVWNLQFEKSTKLGDEGGSSGDTTNPEERVRLDRRYRRRDVLAVGLAQKRTRQMQEPRRASGGALALVCRNPQSIVLSVM
jgi:Zn-finger nucleic acid-binding protein